MNDYYKTLGVARNADADTIKKAYRKLASLYHPDKEGGSKTKFQEVEEAYRTLSDPNKRQQYDNPSPFGPGFSQFHQHNNQFDLDSIFSMFGARFQNPGFHARQRAQMQLWITLKDVAEGGPRTISVGTQHGTQAVNIDIPQGIEDGDSVQYPGIGPGGIDLIITFRIHPNPKFTRMGQNLLVEQLVNIWDLILGCELDITDILNNTLRLTIEPGTQPGSVLRLRERGLTGRGMPVGDLLIKIQAEIPKIIHPDVLEAIEKNHHQ